MKKVFIALLLLATLSFCSCNKANTISTAEETPTEKTYEEAINYEASDESNYETTHETFEQEQPTAPEQPQSFCQKCNAPTSIGHTYCGLHECSESGCTMMSKSMSSYCTMHSCLLCGTKKYINSPYCHKHKCGSCENAVVDGSNYCVAHKCIMCRNKAVGNSSYCSSHKNKYN